MRRQILTGFAVLVYASSAMANQEPLRLKPADNWQLAFEKDSCLLARSFGNGNDSVMIMLERYQPNDEFSLSVIGRPVEVVIPGTPVFVKFGPNEVIQQRSYLPAQNAAGVPSIAFRGEMRIHGEKKNYQKALDYAAGHAPEMKAREMAVTEISILGGTRRDVVLETASLGEPLEAMRDCMTQVASRWGVDPEAHRKFMNHAVPLESPATWLRADDLPASAWAGGRQFMINFRISIDAAGTPSACQIQRSLGSEAIEKIVCDAVMARAKFMPARDNLGKPVPDYFVTAATFQQPKRIP